MTGGTEPRTLAHVLVRLADQSHTGTLHLAWSPSTAARRSPLGHDRVILAISAGRIVGVSTPDGVALRSRFEAILTASGLVTPARLGVLRRKAAQSGTTLEWQLAAANLSSDLLRRYATVDLREWLLELMDTGGFTGRLELGVASADPWQEPIAIAWLAKLWRDRRAERERLGARFPGPNALFRRTRAPATDLFLVRGPTPAGPPPRDREPVSAALPFASRLLYLWVDGRRTTTELGLATGLLDHETRVGLLELQQAGFVEPAGAASRAVAPYRLLPVALSVALLASLVALALVRPFVVEPPPESEPGCGVIARALGLAYRGDGRYPASLEPLVSRGFLTARDAVGATYRPAPEGDDYSLACGALAAMKGRGLPSRVLDGSGPLPRPSPPTTEPAEASP